jgi:hypothetical protein
MASPTCLGCGRRYRRFAKNGHPNRRRLCPQCFRAWKGNLELDTAFLEAVARDDQREAA